MNFLRFMVCFPGFGAGYTRVMGATGYECHDNSNQVFKEFKGFFDSCTKRERILQE